MDERGNSPKFFLTFPAVINRNVPFIFTVQAAAKQTKARPYK